jgi:hypothetical protein
MAAMVGPLHLHPCDQCSAITVCPGCLRRHQSDHMSINSLRPPRALAPAASPVMKPLIVPRRHLRLFPRPTDLHEHTCDSFDYLSLIQAQTLLKWYNLIFAATLKLELHRVAQNGLLRISRPLQHLPLRPPGLAEQILQFAGSTLRPGLIQQVITLQPILVVTAPLLCSAQSTDISCICRGTLYCCCCSKSFCYAHYRACGCFRSQQPFNSMCRLCQASAPSALQCKHCTTGLYFISYRNRLLCPRCGGGFSSGCAAMAHETYCQRRGKAT